MSSAREVQKSERADGARTPLAVITRMDLADPETERRTVQAAGGNSCSLSVNITDHARKTLGVEQGDGVLVKPVGRGYFVLPVSEVGER